MVVLMKDGYFEFRYNIGLGNVSDFFFVLISYIVVNIYKYSRGGLVFFIK